MTRRTKRLIAVLGVVLLAVTVIPPLGCARHNRTETFAKHGFSFEYPESYEMEELGYYDVEANTESSGQVIVRKQGGGTNADRLLLS